METEDERFSRYLRNNRGLWYASCPEMEAWAEQKVREGVLKRLWNIVPKVGERHKGCFISTWAYTFVPKEWKVEDLKTVFSLSHLVDIFGLKELEALDYQI